MAALPSVADALARVQIGHAGDCAHDWRYVRSGGEGPAPRDVPGCEGPRRFVCVLCSTDLVLPCDTGNELRCQPCARRYKLRVQVVARTPALLCRPGTLAFLTLTPRGSRQHCYRGCQVPCEHRKCPCTPPGGASMAEDNGSIGLRYNRFLRDLRRLLGDVQYFRAVETQQRGGLHLHTLLRLESVLLVTPALRTSVRRLAMRHGFGHEIDLQVAGDDARSARLLAWYCAKYVSKAVSDRPEVPWRRWRQPVAAVVGPTSGEVFRDAVKGSPATYRTWTASQRWGSSMGSVKAAQRAWVRSIGQVLDVDGPDSADLDGIGALARHREQARAGPPG